MYFSGSPISALCFDNELSTLILRYNDDHDDDSLSNNSSLYEMFEASHKLYLLQDDQCLLVFLSSVDINFSTMVPYFVVRSSDKYYIKLSKNIFH